MEEWEEYEYREWAVGQELRNRKTIQIIMGDWGSNHSQPLMVSLAQVLHQCYFSRIGRVTFYTTFLVSQAALLTLVVQSFFASAQLTTQLSTSLARLTAYMRLQLQSKRIDWVSVTMVRSFIAFLCLTAALSVLALFIRRKQPSLLLSFIQKHIHHLLSCLLTLAVPFLYFTIWHIFTEKLLQAYFSGIIDTLNGSFLIACIYSLQFFAVESGNTTSNNSIFRNYRNDSGISKMMKIAGTLLVSVRKQGLVVLLVCLLLVEARQLKCLCECRKYVNARLQSLNELVSTIWISTSLVMLAAISFPLHNVTNNLTSLLVTVTLLLHLSVRTYIHYRRYRVILLSQTVEKEQQAITFACQYLANLHTAGQNGDMGRRLLIELSIEKHEARCEDVKCICHESRKGWLVGSNLVSMVTEEVLQGLVDKFPSSFSLKFIALWFRLSHSLMVVNINHQIGQFLKRKNVQGFSFAEMFILLQTKKRIKSKLLDYNCVENHIKAQNIFLEQQIKSKVQELIKNIIHEMSGKHKLLLQDFYSLNAVESYCIRINKAIIAMEQVWNRVCTINSFNHQLYRIFIFYCQNVVPSQIEGKKITHEIMLKLDKLKHLRGFSRDIINKYIYSRKACVIQSNLENSFGTITNTSKYSLEVLGRRREDLIGKDIHSVMPEYFARNHEQSMQAWLQNCTISKYQTQIVEMGYVDAMQTCFQGCFLMKIFPGEDELLFYSIIVRENDNDYVLLNHRQEIQGIGKRLIKENVFTSDNLKHCISEYGDFKFEKRITGFNQQFRAKVILQNLQGEKVLAGEEKPLQSSTKIAPSLYRYECAVSMSKHTLAKQFYYLIKFQNVTKWVSSSCKHIRTTQIGQHVLGSNDRMRTTLKAIDDQLLLAEEYDSVQPVTNNIRFTQLLNLSIKNSSLASNSFSETAYYNHFIKDVKRRLIDPTLLRLPPFRKLTVLLFFLVTCMGLQFFSLRVLFQQGFRSFNDVMFGDGAVSDNNQILQIMYNDVHMSRIYCGQELSSPRCQYLLASSSSLNQILYGLYHSQVQVYLQNRTSLSGIKLYASYDIPVSFSLSSGSSEMISTLQFMEYFYGAVKKLYNEVAVGRAYSDEADVAMRVLLANWETMKFVNHNAIYFYLDAGQDELDMLLDYLLLLGASMVFCIVAMGVGLKAYENTVLKKKVNVLAIHGCMNDQLLRQITDYYLYIKEIAQELKFLPDRFQPTSEDHIHQENRREMKYYQSKLCLIQILIVVLLLAMLGGLEILKVGLVLPSCMQMVQKINDLMDSENYLLENYFQLKTYYLTSNFSKSVDQITQEIAKHLNQTDPVFTQVAKGSIDIFSADPTFSQDFNDLLVNDVCNLTALVVQPWQALYCIQNFTTGLLQLGLVNSMTFFQRHAFEALTELQKKQKQNINKTAYFQQQIYEDIDDSIFYMFRLYQATQARMYQGLNYSVNSALPYLEAINVAAVSILIFVVCWWLKGYRGEQHKMCQLYGAVLQFPQAIMKPEIITKINTVLELDN